jgi:hypothetical protein
MYQYLGLESLFIKPDGSYFQVIIYLKILDDENVLTVRQRATNIYDIAKKFDYYTLT